MLQLRIEQDDKMTHVYLDSPTFNPDSPDPTTVMSWHVPQSGERTATDDALDAFEHMLRDAPYMFVKALIDRLST